MIQYNTIQYVITIQTKGKEFSKDLCEALRSLKCIACASATRDLTFTQIRRSQKMHFLLFVFKIKSFLCCYH